MHTSAHTSACHGGGDAAARRLMASRAITIGATLRATGALSAFGTSLELGYRQAIEELSDRVGLDARLLVLDNRSEPGLASKQARDLIAAEGALALLGGATPPLSIPISVVA